MFCKIVEIIFELGGKYGVSFFIEFVLEYASRIFEFTFRLTQQFLVLKHLIPSIKQ